MISLIIKSYFAILLSVGLGSLFAFITGFYCIVRACSKNKNKVQKINEDAAILHGKNKEIKNDCTASELLESEKNDISAISGDDIIATQLDLARAYLETGKTPLAKKILEQVMHQGSEEQQKEAKNLLGFI